MTIAIDQRATALRYGTPEEAGLRADRLPLLRELGQQWIDAGIMPALVLLVARRGVIVLHEAFGTLEGSGSPVLRDSIFPLASMTKPITATAIMLLVEE